ncbi:MAG: flavodoxin family protein [Pseudonocardiaceae bacterium]|nr:flavodoxin family protein [Pseudonocardiaceae bacterium]
MKVLWILAHPEQRSLNGSLRDEGLRELTNLGHEYRQSDLYAMRWNPVVDGDDFQHDPRERLDVAEESERAYTSGRLAGDIRVEQQKLEWADTLVLQFPLWWHGMPAILKGWFDRVFVKGFAYGVRDPASGRTLRYGNGGLAGKRAMVVVSVGAPEITIGPRGIHGDINDLLFPVQHGALWYAGISVAPPLVIAGANRLSDADYDTSAKQLRERLRTLPTAEPLPFRHQDGGDYDESLVLRPELASRHAGLRVHYVGAETFPR